MTTDDFQEPEATAVSAGGTCPNSPATNGASLIDQILSPQTLQRMMACGGGLLVLGFVGWLWSIGVFKNPIVVASMMGITTLSVMGIGIGLLRYSRYELAGNGMTLLAALAMPLNLWFYDAQGLITISNGGHLWIPAAICCAIYAFVARVLRRPVFVYALVGGIVMTGMLFLADQAVGHFWELLPPATFLVVMGWVCIHVELLFESNEGDFSREKFGKAFHRAGIATLSGGLAILASGQVAALLHEHFSFLISPALATDSMQKVWALTLVSLSAIGFIGQSLVSRNRYWLSATGLAIWSAFCLLDLFSISLRLPHFAIAISLAVTMVNLFRFSNISTDENEVTGTTVSRNRPQDFPIELAVTGLIFFGLAQFVAQFQPSPTSFVFEQASWLVVVQLAMTAVASATTYLRFCDATPTATNVTPSGNGFLAVAAVLGTLSALSVAIVLGFDSIDLFAVLGFLVPVAFITWSLANRNSQHSSAATKAASWGVSSLLFCLVGLTIDRGVGAWDGHFTWASIFAAAATSYLIASRHRPTGVDRMLGYAAATGSTCNLMSLAGLSFDYSIPLATTFTGVILAIVNAVRRESVSDLTTGKTVYRKDSFEIAANALVTVGVVFGILLAFSRLANQHTDIRLLWVMGGQLLGIMLAGLLTVRHSWRLLFRAEGFAVAIVTACIGNSLITAHWGHKVELVAMLVGLTLLVIGHAAWYREGEKEDDGATASLFLGSLLSTIPVGIGLVYYRSFEVSSDWNWMLFHEIAAILIGLTLFGLGCACRIRSTTICGAGLLTTCVVSLLSLVQWPGQLQSVSMVMMVGGGTFFVTAVLLSIYRDRIADLPAHIQEGRGVFRVLRWR